MTYRPRTCCDQSCRQGRDCPARADKAYPLSTGQSLKASITQGPQAQAATENVAPTDRKDQLLHLLQWLAITAFTGITLACVVGFFNASTH